MKIKLTLLLAITCFSFQTFAFNWEWARKLKTPTQIKGMFCDNDSNLYIYGCNFPPNANQYDLFYYPAIIADTTGSWIQKYDHSTGQLMFQKRWRGIPFFVEKIIFDGNASFYFTGLFSGSFNVDGVQITSRGKADGLAGKMDMNGNIQWITTLGSGKDERGQGMCFDAGKTHIAITGTTTDSLLVNNTLIGSGQQSTFVVILDLNGNYTSHKLYDFFPARDHEAEGNYGKEIVYSAGFYYLLTDRQGMHWNSDTLSGAVDGRYVYKLDMNLDTLWTKYIVGPACYYGWGSTGLVASATGDIYIGKWCSSHYGGTGHLNKLDVATGNFIYDEVLHDGEFYHLHANATGLYTVGEEGADYAPGPNSHYGQTIVKQYSYANVKLDSIKMPQGYNPATGLTEDGGAGIYFSAINMSDSLVIVGNDTLVADTNINGGYQTHFLVRIGQNFTAQTEFTSHATNQFSVFPNPTHGQINLQVSEDLKQAKVCVYDVLGSCILSKQLENTNTKLDLGARAGGVYFVVLNGKGKSITRKLVLD